MCVIKQFRWGKIPAKTSAANSNTQVFLTHGHLADFPRQRSVIHPNSCRNISQHQSLSSNIISAWQHHVLCLCLGCASNTQSGTIELAWDLNSSGLRKRLGRDKRVGSSGEGRPKEGKIWEWWWFEPSPQYSSGDLTTWELTLSLITRLLRQEIQVLSILEHNY